MGIGFIAAGRGVDIGVRSAAAIQVFVAGTGVDDVVAPVAVDGSADRRAFLIQQYLLDLGIAPAHAVREGDWLQLAAVGVFAAHGHRLPVRVLVITISVPPFGRTKTTN